MEKNRYVYTHCGTHIPNKCTYECNAHFETEPVGFDESIMLHWMLLRVQVAIYYILYLSESKVVDYELNNYVILFGVINIKG